MSPEVTLADTAAIAARVLTTLDALHGELDAAVNPHRVALRHLGMTDAFGGARIPYHDEAFKVWSELRGRNPHDLEAAHHLAIMHHARAIDLEEGADPRRSDADWTMAMQLWHELWLADAFWQHLAERASGTIGPGVWRALRDRLPLLLLAIHYEIALDVERTKVHRAKFHLGLVRAAPYPAEAKAAAQREAYTRFISVVPYTVWQYQETNPEAIKVGTDRIEQFLALESGCVPALEDAVRLQVRVLSAWATDLRAVGDDERRRTRLLQMIRGAAKHWRPYFDTLAGHTGLDDEVRRKLGLWYRLMGEVHGALDEHEVAVGFFAQGVESTRPEDDEHRRCAEQWVEASALVAREQAAAGKTDARPRCDDLRARADLTIKAHFLLANAYALLQDFDAAGEVCERGLAIEPDPTDIDAIEAHARDRALLEEMRGHIQTARETAQVKGLLDEGVEAMRKDRLEDARALFDRAARMAPREGAVYFLRAQCHLGLGDVGAARRDLATLNSLDPGAEAREAAAELSKHVERLGAQLDRYGRDGMRLRNEAVAAANAEQFDRAAALLKEAIEQCAGPGKAEFQRDLATVLTNQAIKSVNDAMEDPISRIVGAQVVYGMALAKLREAQRLDPSSARIRKAIEDLQRMMLP